MSCLSSVPSNRTYSHSIIYILLDWPNGDALLNELKWDHLQRVARILRLSRSYHFNPITCIYLTNTLLKTILSAALLCQHPLFILFSLRHHLVKALIVHTTCFPLETEHRKLLSSSSFPVPTCLRPRPRRETVNHLRNRDSRSMSADRHRLLRTRIRRHQPPLQLRR